MRANLSYDRMTTKQITATNADEQIKQLYQTAFPEEEQIPWDNLLRLIGEMGLDFTAYYDGEDFIGFTIVYPRLSFSWFWYFAVRKDILSPSLIYGKRPKIRLPKLLI